MSERKHVTVYTDGACQGNPGRGGYAAVLLCEGRRRELSGGRRLTTNNRMELLAAVSALQALRFPCVVTLYSDSRYVVDGVSKGWALRWREAGWLRAAGGPAVNADLWSALLDQCDRHQVDFVWVRGHAGDVENERCDRLSVLAAQADDLPADEAYEDREEPAPAAARSPQPTLFDWAGG